MNPMNVLKDLFDQLAGRDDMREQQPRRPRQPGGRMTTQVELRRPLRGQIGVVTDLVNQLRGSTAKPKKPPAQAWIPPQGDFYTGSLVEGRRMTQPGPEGQSREVTTPVYDSRIYNENDPDERAHRKSVRNQSRY